MRTTTRILIPTLLAAVVLAGCDSRISRSDSGGVALSVTDFDGLPVRIAVNTSGSIVVVGEISLQNVVNDPNGVSSDLMNVEIQSYEVLYSRADRGTRVPPRLVNGLFGVVPAGGTFDVEGLPVMLAQQFQVPPLFDLFFQNGGFDKETGESVVTINFRLRFFGRTLSGDAVESAPAQFTVEFIP